MLDPATATNLRTQLLAIPRLAALALLALEPASSTRYGTIHTGRTHAPAPVNEAVLSLLGPGDYLREADPGHDQIGQMPATAVLSAWCRVVTGRTCRNISTACGTLLERWPTVTESPWSYRLAADIGRLHGALAAAAHVHAHRRALELPCPRCTLLALEARAGGDIACSNCEATMSQAAYDQRVGKYADKIGA